MKFRFDKKYLYWGLVGTFSIIAGILFYYILFHSESLSNAVHSFIKISMPIIDGLILAYLMTPVMNIWRTLLSFHVGRGAFVELLSVGR